MSRFDRQIALFGAEGQQLIEGASVAIVGVGGLGTHVVQQLALLGVRQFTLIDPQELDETNRNRYIGARHDDPVPGTWKVDIGERLVRAVEPEAEVVKVRAQLQTRKAYEALSAADVIFGCVDLESLRFILNHYSVCLGKRMIDAATGVVVDGGIQYGGQLFVMWEPPGCMVCCGSIDMSDVNRELASPEDQANRESVYGVEASLLGDSGPSVVSLNGTIASMAVTEFMVGITGLRPPLRALTYRADTLKFGVSAKAGGDCFTCSLWGVGEAAEPGQFWR